MEKVSLRVNEGTVSFWNDGDQISEQTSRDTHDSELGLRLFCYTDTQENAYDGHGSTNQISTESLGSDCNAEEEQTPLKMCSVKLEDCRNLTKMKRETTDDEERSDDEDDDNNDDDDDDVFFPS
ncbi:hypothetical protein M9458_045749, partial [Cirrhinus mrigala]